MGEVDLESMRRKRPPKKPNLFALGDRVCRYEGYAGVATLVNVARGFEEPRGDEVHHSRRVAVLAVNSPQGGLLLGGFRWWPMNGGLPKT